MEHHEPPEYIVREVKKIGGMENGQPRFRVIWGGDRIRFTEDGVIYHPYHVNRWHVEKLHEGEYEHSYTLAHCPHVRNSRWCNECFKSGGEFLPLALGPVEAAIRLVLRAETLQSAALQKAALLEREAKKKEERDKAIEGWIPAVAAATPKRSYQPVISETAENTLGRSKFRQLKARSDAN